MYLSTSEKRMFRSISHVFSKSLIPWREALDLCGVTFESHGCRTNYASGGPRYRMIWRSRDEPQLFTSPPQRRGSLSFCLPLLHMVPSHIFYLFAGSLSEYPEMSYALGLNSRLN